jgi:hypothetical protein
MGVAAAVGLTGSPAREDVQASSAVSWDAHPTSPPTAHSGRAGGSCRPV